MDIKTTTRTEKIYTITDDPIGTCFKITIEFTSTSGHPSSANVSLILKVHEHEYVYEAEHANEKECVWDLAGIPRDVLIQEIAEAETFNMEKSLQQTFEMLDMMKGYCIEEQTMSIIKHDIEESVRTNTENMTVICFYTQVQSALSRHDQTYSIDILQELPVIAMDYPDDAIYAANTFIEHIQPLLKEE